MKEGTKNRPPITIVTVSMPMSTLDQLDSLQKVTKSSGRSETVRKLIDAATRMTGGVVAGQSA